MAINVTTWLFRSDSFCCCIPVRAGFVLISLLTLLLSGAISVIIWFEIFHSNEFSTKERVAFILTGILESLLFVASVMGMIGVVARKQLFVMIYTYFLYVHFILNLIIGIYFLVTVRASNREQLVNYCADVFVDTSIGSSCMSLMGISTYVLIAIVAVLLFLELYAILIATRYVYRLRMQKRDDRSRRMGYFHALSKPESFSTRHIRQASDNIELLSSPESHGDLADLVDPVIDIRPESYMRVPTHDHDPLPLPAPSPSSAARTLSETSSVRRFRALPPRPTALSLPQEKGPSPGRLPNPHEHSTDAPKWGETQPPGNDDERHSIYTAEVSTTAHAALMEHATYMGTMFSSAPAVPNNSQRSLR
ncbi:hypothetical protein JVU11DRAFT_2594 [Chiua virens]|nr:hypothetical protein JVU11DRAFT_2594 [Chiua virens]